MKMHVPSQALVKSPARLIAIAALMVACSPVGALNAAASTVARNAAQGQHESLDQRISNLHHTLMITHAEEGAWQNIATVMRNNQAQMMKLAHDAKMHNPDNESALGALETYANLSAAHAAGVKNLVSAFSTLYTEMPASQKALADQTFSHHRAQA